MTTSFESEPERTELSTQVLPTIPTVQEMKTWDEEKVLRWIQQRNQNILKGDNLEKFNKAGFTGSDFSISTVEFFNKLCGLSVGASLLLDDLLNEVKRPRKFIL